MRTIANARNALKSVGFELQHEDDLANRECIVNFYAYSPGGDAIPWYYPLEGDIFKAQTVWDSESCRGLHWSRLQYQCLPCGECLASVDSSPKTLFGVSRSAGLCPRELTTWESLLSVPKQLWLLVEGRNSSREYMQVLRAHEQSDGLVDL